MVSAFEGNPNPVRTDLETCKEIMNEKTEYKSMKHEEFAGRMYD